jgi:hypothetical protein
MPPVIDSYNGHVKAYVIDNPVPTPEELGEILGLSSERVSTVRRIMSEPARQRKAVRPGGKTRVAARKKSSRGRKTARAAAKR